MGVGPARWTLVLGSFKGFSEFRSDFTLSCFEDDFSVTLVGQHLDLTIFLCHISMQLYLARFRVPILFCRRPKPGFGCCVLTDPWEILQTESA